MSVMFKPPQNTPLQKHPPLDTPPQKHRSLQEFDDQLELLQHALGNLMVQKATMQERVQGIQSQCAEVEHDVSTIETKLVSSSMQAAELLMLTQQLQGDPNYVLQPEEPQPAQTKTGGFGFGRALRAHASFNGGG